MTKNHEQSISRDAAWARKALYSSFLWMRR